MTHLTRSEIPSLKIQIFQALEEELRVVGNNLQTLEVGEEKSRSR